MWAFYRLDGYTRPTLAPLSLARSRIGVPRRSSRPTHDSRSAFQAARCCSSATVIQRKAKNPSGAELYFGLGGRDFGETPRVTNNSFCPTITKTAPRAYRRVLIVERNRRYEQFISRENKRNELLPMTIIPSTSVIIFAEQARSTMNFIFTQIFNPKPLS